MQDQVNATPAPEQADKVLRSPCRLESAEWRQPLHLWLDNALLSR